MKRLKRLLCRFHGHRMRTTKEKCIGRRNGMPIYNIKNEICDRCRLYRVYDNKQRLKKEFYYD